ncbi:uncharacterized protein EKO05_0000357 [Ascochyta rabiei]|uniref:uncharacterized protein n=1 Tax=Didymella rabiei TaxID=5454 RepID=UPI0021FDF7C6|nr:uncharacterized protein EKO05_0000357 [Ascochyta rabiei]UPX09673.1 hypothetical protein EKO05_0000357 [Ascochyta rabiei]
MASPQESITTVNGRRCTRSRARTAATSAPISTPAAPPTAVAPTETTTSTVAEQKPQTKPTAASSPAPQVPPPPPPPPPPPLAPPVSSSQAEQSAVVVPLPTSQAAVSSPLAVIEPLPSSSLTTSPVAQPIVTETAGVVVSTSVAAVPDVIQTDSSSQTPLPVTSIAELLPQTSSAAISNPTHGPVGVIAPEQGTHTGGDGHTGEDHSSYSDSNPNIGGIIGGVVGGFVALALLSALLFFCLRRRKSKEAGWNEKSEVLSGFLSKAKAVPAGFGVFFARFRNEKTGPLDNPYQRHQPRSSVGSVYSTTSNGRGRSISELQRQPASGGGFVRRMSSRKSERNVLRKKTSSVSSQSPFMDVSEELVRNNNVGSNPFADPGPDTPRNLRISNPDTLEEQTRGPSPPQPAVTPRAARDPFASLIDEIDGAPNWLRDSNMSASNHRRIQSSASALRAHPPSSVYSSDPFADLSSIPPMPTQQPQPPLSTYSAFPAVRDSNYTIFGEPGPSRPSTTMFTPGLPSNPSASRDTNIFNTPATTPGFPSSGPPTSTSRLDRQSDPFDLDRPEVLSFKGMMNQMRDSIARQTTIRSRRTSSVSNWFGRDASPSGALNGASVRR